MLKANPNRIGNARQQNDNLIAVADALSLGECFRQVEACLLVGHEDTPLGKRVAAMFKAGTLLRRAISGGDLPLWRIHNAREVQIAPLDLDPDNIRYGVFKTYERPEPDMQGARLWVKSGQWETFLSKLRASQELVKSSAKPRVGRPGKVEAVRKKLLELYPDQSERSRVPSKDAARVVSRALMLDVSDSTVKRALGRKN